MREYRLSLTFKGTFREQNSREICIKICILESRTSSFQVQSNDVESFQAVYWKNKPALFDYFEKLFSPL